MPDEEREEEVVEVAEAEEVEVETEESAPAGDLSGADMSTLKEHIGLLERRVEVIEARENPEPMRGTAVDFMTDINGSSAVIVDEGVARATPCSRFTFRSGKALVFSKGAIGPLDESQQALYCAEMVDKPLTPEQERREEAFVDAASTCKTEIRKFAKAERINPWLACMSRETKARGVEFK